MGNWPSAGDIIQPFEDGVSARALLSSIRRHPAVDIITAPAIVRASSLDAMSPTIKYKDNAIVLDPNGNFLGFAHYKLSDENGPRNFLFEAMRKVTAAAIKVPNFDICWFKSHPGLPEKIDLWRKDQIAFALSVDGKLL